MIERMERLQVMNDNDNHVAIMMNVHTNSA